MQPRYLGPLIVLTRNKGGAYVLAELIGSVLDRPVAVFHVIPYFARKAIPLPPLAALIDVSLEHFQALQDSEDEDPDASDVSADEDDSDSDELASQPVLQVSVSSVLPPSRSECLSRPPCLVSFVGGLFTDAAHTVSICPRSLVPCF